MLALNHVKTERPIFQEVLRSPPSACNQLPQEGVRAHLQHPPQEEAEVDGNESLAIEPSGHVDNSVAAFSIKKTKKCSGTLSPPLSE